MTRSRSVTRQGQFGQDPAAPSSVLQGYQSAQNSKYNSAFIDRNLLPFKKYGLSQDLSTYQGKSDTVLRQMAVKAAIGQFKDANPGQIGPQKKPPTKPPVKQPTKKPVRKPVKQPHAKHPPVKIPHPKLPHTPPSPKNRKPGPTHPVKHTKPKPKPPVRGYGGRGPTQS